MTCLQSHLDELYLHATLTLRALEANGYRSPVAVFTSPGVVKRALRRYFYAALLTNSTGKRGDAAVSQRW